jgi:hypothetical protein
MGLCDNIRKAAENAVEDPGWMSWPPDEGQVPEPSTGAGRG